MRAAILGVTGVIAALTPAIGQNEPSLAGKQVRMVIGSAPGGTYDLLGRAVARHIGRHLPGNPTLVPQNMPGGGGLAAANFIYNAAPKDGSVIAITNKGVAGVAIAGAPEARFDAVKMTWLGTPITETSVCFAYNSPKLQARSLSDLYAKELLVGSPGAGTVATAYPKALAALLGLRFRLVGGYPGANQIYLAMERGEVEGFCEGLDGIVAKRPNWIPDKVITLLLHGGAQRNAGLAAVPYIIDHAKTDADRQALEFLYAAEGIGRPFFAPPDLPPAVLAMLRGAFDRTMRDPEFMTDAQKLGFDPRPENGSYLDALIRRMAATPKAIKDKVVEVTK